MNAQLKWLRMQLMPKRGGVRRQLIAASCALLGTSIARSQQAASADTDNSGRAANWALDFALAYYQESGRIRASEPVVNIREDDADGTDAAADTRLGAFEALTCGVKFAVKLNAQPDQLG